MASVSSPDAVGGRPTAPLGGGSGDRDPLPEGHELDDGRYRLGEPLGQGGFGITYAAVDQRLRRPVAIKELFPERARRSGTTVVVPGDAAPGFARARARFLREARTLARFGHPNIVRIFAVIEAHGTAYIVLERVQGTTLAAEVRRRQGPLAEAEALDVAVQAGAALAVVHRAGVLHRDVSPANLVRTPDGRIVLIDFGLARPYEDDHTTSMTRIVTPGYAPPEQYRGEGRFSPRADVYALGATLYRLLSGRTPATPAARDAGRDVPSLWQLNPTVSRQVSDAVGAALALDPADRPAGIAVLLDRLGADPSGVELEPEVGPGGASGPDLLEADGDVDDLRATEVVRPSAPRRAVAAVSPVDLDGPTEVVRPGGRGGPAALPAEEARRSWVVPVPEELRPRPVARPAPPVVEDRPAPPGWGHPGWGHPGWGPPGRGAPGRGWVALPLGAAAVALTSAQPVTLTVALGLVVAPVLATVGDRVLRPRRNPAVVATWFLRNVLVGLGRALAPALVLVLGLLLWWGADAIDALRPAAPWVLRATGVATGWILAAQIGRGSRRAHSDVAVDALALRLMPRGRLTLGAVVLLIVCLGATAAGLWFEPEAWPLR